MTADTKAMTEGRKAKVDDGADRLGWDVEAPRDLVSPLEFAGGLWAPALSDDELDELCTIEIAALSRPRSKESID